MRYDRAPLTEWLSFASDLRPRTSCRSRKSDLSRLPRFSVPIKGSHETNRGGISRHKRSTLADLNRARGSIATGLFSDLIDPWTRENRLESISIGCKDGNNVGSPVVVGDEE